MTWVNIVIDVLLFFFVIICGLMSLVILMQRSKQEGLGAAFGGGFTDSVFGAQTSQVLVKTTVFLAALFFILSISMARLYAIRAHDLPRTKESPLNTLLPSAAVVTPASSPTSNAAPVIVSPTSSKTPSTSAPAVVPSTPSQSPSSPAPKVDHSASSKTPAPAPAKP